MVICTLYSSLFLYLIVDLLINNLIITLDLPVDAGPQPRSKLFPYLPFDEFGNPRYMDEVPYSAG